MKVCAATGHRPNKLGGHGHAVDNALRDLAYNFLRVEQPDIAISGMALGWDMAFAEAAISLGIPTVAAVPFAGQESKWPAASQHRYRQLCQVARVTVVCDGGYSPEKMQKRNEWMVDNSTMLVALWDGTAGGTCNCINYARKVNRHTVNLWLQWKK
jgi:uncharacterized phage-like protein YoqJ